MSGYFELKSWGSGVHEECLHRTVGSAGVWVST